MVVIRILHGICVGVLFLIRFQLVIIVADRLAAFVDPLCAGKIDLFAFFAHI